MSMLDRIAEYNRRIEEEKKLLDERKFREKVISNLEEKLNFEIEYPGVKEIEKEMKEGSRVRIRRNRVYANENNGIGTIDKIVAGLPYSIHVKFDDGPYYPYRKKHLELAEKYTKEELKQIKEENKEKIEEFYQKPFNLFKEYLKQQVEEINSKEFKVEDEIIMNAKANEAFSHLRMGSKGKIIEDYKSESFLVRFSEITGGELDWKVFSINKKYMEHLIPKEDPEKLIQESIELAKNKFNK